MRISISENIKNSEKKEIKKTDKIKLADLRELAHDIRNTLNSIKGSALLLQSAPEDINTVSELAGLIERASESILFSLDKFIYEKSKSKNTSELDISTENISIIIDNIIKAISPLAINKNQKIIFNREKKVFAEIDRFKFSSMVENLISNAIKYSPFGSEINIDVALRDSYFRLIVKDEGPGFSKKDLELVFKENTKLSAKPTGNEKSHGYGLFIVKKIVDAHNGNIWIKNENPGCSIFVEIPIDFKK